MTLYETTHEVINSNIGANTKDILLATLASYLLLLIMIWSIMDKELNKFKLENIPYKF